LILHGSLKDPVYLRLARESEAFYNAFFPDHDNGGIYFNVMANGLPYLVGTERLKGSHSMSAYHSFELGYLAAVYSNLLITKQPMDFYFKPQQGAFKDNILHVQPDLLPPGSVRLEAVWINGDPYKDFDAEAMTVKLPALSEQNLPEQRPPWAGNPAHAPDTKYALSVRVRLVPSSRQFDAILDVANDIVQIALYGNLNDAAEPDLKMQLDKIVAANPKSVVIRMENLQVLSKQCARALSFIAGKLILKENIYLVGANANVRKTLQDVDVWEEYSTMDRYDPNKISKQPKRKAAAATL